MGLFKAAKEAIGTTMHDQWKDIISCENMTNDVLMMRKTTDTGEITKKSIIRVLPGQCAVIIQNGKVLDATAEEGDYLFDESLTPSFFAGNFGAVFKDMWQRFTFGGGTPNKQAVYFFNLKEIMDNKFGTATPIPYQDWSHPIPNQMTGTMSPLRVEVKCFGKYTFKISDPAVFMSRIAGTAEEYRKDELCEQMRSEVIGAFQNVLNELGTSEHKVPVLELPSSTDEIKRVMDEKVFDQPIRDRGLSILGFVVESVTLDDESNEKIDNYELSSNQFMQQGTLTGAYANAVQDAANNEAGAVNGFLGVGMMNMASGGVMGGVSNAAMSGQGTTTAQPYNPYANQAAETIANAKAVAVNQAAQTVQPVQGSQPIVQGATIGTASFCPNCGTPTNGGNFCTKCGTKLN